MRNWTPHKFYVCEWDGVKNLQHTILWYYGTQGKQQMTQE